MPAIFRHEPRATLTTRRTERSQVSEKMPPRGIRVRQLDRDRGCPSCLTGMRNNFFPNGMYRCSMPPSLKLKSEIPD